MAKTLTIASAPVDAIRLSVDQVERVGLQPPLDDDGASYGLSLGKVSLSGLLHSLSETDHGLNSWNGCGL
jgi:hypothetical protein